VERVSKGRPRSPMLAQAAGPPSVDANSIGVSSPWLEWVGGSCNHQARLPYFARPRSGSGACRKISILRSLRIQAS
jgi:hypothetical protein